MKRALFIQKFEIWFYAFCLSMVLASCWKEYEPYSKEPILVPTSTPTPIVTMTPLVTTVPTSSGVKVKSAVTKVREMRGSR